MQRNTRIKLKIGLALGLALLALVVILQNVEPLTVQLLFATVTMPRAALLAITLLIGFVIGALVALAYRRR